MAQKETYEELKRQRSYHERKLIDELKFKRSCVRLAPTLPSEAEVQRKIRKFIREILRLTKENHLQDAFTEVQGARTSHYARAEATLYKSKMEGVWLKANHIKGCIRGAMEGLAMAHEAYKFLILAEAATDESRQKFYDTDIEGVSIEPAFIVEYTRKEMDFLDELLRNIEGEMKNAEIQLSLEQHTNPIAELIEIVSGFCQDMTESNNHLQQEVETQKRQIQEIAEVLKAIREDIAILNQRQAATEAQRVLLTEQHVTKDVVQDTVSEETNEEPAEFDEGEADQTKDAVQDTGPAEFDEVEGDQTEDLVQDTGSREFDEVEAGQTQPRTGDPVQDTVPRGGEEVQEDLLDLGDDYDCEQEFECRDDETLVHNEDQSNRHHESKQETPQEERRSRSKRKKDTVGQSPDPLEPERKRRKLVEELEWLSKDIRANRHCPRRTIAYIMEMREEDKFLRCSFCDRKGLHYSDNCPFVSIVSERCKRVWCNYCLDTWHSTDRCWRKKPFCKYCFTRKHHSALCETPEKAEREEARFRLLQQELEDLEQHYGGPSR